MAIQGNNQQEISYLAQTIQEVKEGEELVINTNQAVHRAPAGYRIMGISYYNEGDRLKIERNFVYNSGTGLIKGMISERKVLSDNTVTIAIIYRRF